MFDARIEGRRLEFGVSGLLYQSDVLMYDRATESLWSQLAFEAISGPLSGTELEVVPATHTTWGDWRGSHPETRVLSFQTGHIRDYDRDPYAGYAEVPGLYFPVSQRDDRYPAKSWVAGIVLGGQARAYPFSELARTGGDWVSDRIGKESLQIRFDPATRRVDARDARGQALPVIPAFWFAWHAFYPEGTVFTSGP